MIKKSVPGIFSCPRVFVFILLLASVTSCRDEVMHPADYTRVSTLAGSDGPGKEDGTGNLARFNNPSGIVIDPAGNLYVSDYSNHTIRKVTPGGAVTTFAGTGEAGYKNGPAGEAMFDHPYGLAIDSEGNLYVGDVNNHKIRRISPSGMVTTFAGRNRGYSDQHGDMAMFNRPHGLAIDSRNNLYVADSYNHRIRKITPGGDVTTLAGNGDDGFVDAAGKDAEFYVPIGIAADGRGNVYVSDEGNSSIRKISPKGVVTTLAGNGKFSHLDGVGRHAEFNAPGGLAIDRHGILYVADYMNNCIRQVSQSGEVRTIAGSTKKGFADGEPGDAQFYYPFGIAVDTRGTVFVSDHFNHRIRKIE